MVDANAIISNATRSTLFGRFYEGIVSTWLEKKRSYELVRHSSGRPHKPRIYWASIPRKRFHIGEDKPFKPRFEELRGRSHCTPDGCLIKGNKYYIWEAKNWPLYPERGPEYQVWKYFSSHPWILATTFSLGGQEHDISGFLFSFWDMSESTKSRIEKVVCDLIHPITFEIILTSEIIEDCIRHRYPWYVQIVRTERDDITKFFAQLLGEE